MKINKSVMLLLPLHPLLPPATCLLLPVAARPMRPAYLLLPSCPFFAPAARCILPFLRCRRLRACCCLLPPAASASWMPQGSPSAYSRSAASCTPCRAALVLSAVLALLALLAVGAAALLPCSLLGSVSLSPLAVGSAALWAGSLSCGVLGSRRWLLSAVCCLLGSCRLLPRGAVSLSPLLPWLPSPRAGLSPLAVGCSALRPCAPCGTPSRAAAMLPCVLVLRAGCRLLCCAPVFCCLSLLGWLGSVSLSPLAVGYAALLPCAPSSSWAGSWAALPQPSGLQRASQQRANRSRSSLLSLSVLAAGQWRRWALLSALHCSHGCRLCCWLRLVCFGVGGAQAECT